jgi:hypothetical protein
MKSGPEWYKLTAPIDATLIADFMREDRCVSLPAGTLFRVDSSRGVSADCPKGPFNLIAAKSNRYRVASAVLEGKWVTIETVSPISAQVSNRSGSTTVDARRFF